MLLQNYSHRGKVHINNNECIIINVSVVGFMMLYSKWYFINSFLNFLRGSSLKIQMLGANSQDCVYVVCMNIKWNAIFMTRKGIKAFKETLCYFSWLEQVWTIRLLVNLFLVKNFCIKWHGWFRNKLFRFKSFYEKKHAKACHICLKV